jgi:CBS domain-containing protein
MSKAYDAMAHALATCAPDASVANVAAIMRDRDIGDVLVVADGKLCGIVTDRDLALQALTGKDDPLQTPIRKFMSSKVVTGKATWSLEHVAKIMARHQIRRLPIVQDGQLIGIISLGDVARHEGRKAVISKSLRDISTPIDLSAPRRSGRGGVVAGFALAALATTMVAWLTWNHSSHPLRKQIPDSEMEGLDL